MGLMALFKGASHWRPTITSSSCLSMKPGPKAVRVEATLGSQSSTPPRSLSAFISAITFSHKAAVFSVAPARKLASPSYGTKFCFTKAATSIWEGIFGTGRVSASISNLRPSLRERPSPFGADGGSAMADLETRGRRESTGEALRALFPIPHGLTADEARGAGGRADATPSRLADGRLSIVRMAAELSAIAETREVLDHGRMNAARK
mmetsp:Transcript_16803/g.46965  ORF Transcript_16803/g.46965 Transcript_16803/m.46965 type:complete len:207 (+) Transcript_16803:2310-2930(+)